MVCGNYRLCIWTSSQINKTLSSVVNGCFNNKDAHSVGFVVRWLNEHCHRLIFPVHRCDWVFARL